MNKLEKIINPEESDYLFINGLDKKINKISFKIMNFIRDDEYIVILGLINKDLNYNDINIKVTIY